MFSYLSPTTFIKFHKQCEWRIYLEKVKGVIPQEQYENQQTMAQAAGVAFDILVKGALNRRIKVSEELHKEILPKNQAAIQLAEEIFKCYEKEPMSSLKQEGIGYGAVDQETEITWEEGEHHSTCLKIAYHEDSPCDCKQVKQYKSILYGKPDLTLTDGTVIDWKCSGMFGRGRTPDNGYIRCYVYGVGHPFHGKDMGSSGKCDTPLEQINSDWAIQTYLYARLLGRKVADPTLRAGIESICISPENYVYCASYRNPISVEFQVKIEKAFHVAFSKLTYIKELEENGGKLRKEGLCIIEAQDIIEPPHPTKRKCISYGKLCPAAEWCHGYKALEGRGFPHE